jgi:four helix bundle protein
MNEKENVLLVKSLAFAVRVMNLNKWFYTNHREIRDVSNQLLKSGTSIGANAEEADGAFSKKEFNVKIGISLKEAKESRYWLRVLHASNYLDNKMYDSLLIDIQELIKLLTAILKSSRENMG